MTPLRTAAALLLMALPAAADPAMVAQTAKGPTLVDAAGMTLYIFTPDTAETSACTGLCAVAWPPLSARGDDAASGKWTVISRPTEGTHQWAHDGHPLYTYAKDSKPGEITGDGKDGGKWQVAQP